METSRLAAQRQREASLYALATGLGRPIVRALFRPAVTGCEHLQQGAFVLAANQLSNLDGVALTYAAAGRRLRWMGKAELFRGPLAPVLRRLGVFPVERGAGDVAALATAVALARDGDAVALFPEGTRRSKGWRKRHVPKPHAGAARIALTADVPLIPAAIVGTERVLGLRRWRIAFGRPVSRAELPTHPRLAARELTGRLMEDIAVLESRLAAERGAARRLLHPRLVLDVSLRDLAFALVSCLGASRTRSERRVLDAWDGGRDGLVCLSLRSAFDLLLEALALPPGDEVAFSALTHPDMPRIARAHSLVPVPVDVDEATLAPTPETLAHAFGPRTSLVVVAHLFGTREPLDVIAAMTHEQGALLVEDCAQAFRGPADTGDPATDVSLFSFGPIKATTALGGALSRVRNPATLERMRTLHEALPVTSRRSYARRVVKVAALVVLGRPRVYWCFAQTLRVLGRDLDATVNGAVRGFPHDRLLTSIRRRPPAPLLALLARRLQRFDSRALAERRRSGDEVVASLPPALVHPGRGASARDHWIVPLLADGRDAAIARLRAAGFDAARATSGIAAVEAPPERARMLPMTARRIMESVFFVPAYARVGDGELRRLRRLLQDML